jgi:hypothetical protein
MSQKDEPVYPPHKGKSEYSVEIILHSSQFMEMYEAFGGEI